MIRWICKSFDQLTTIELYQILALRQEVFVVEQYCPYQDADNIDLECFHQMGFDKNNKLIAYARLIPKGISYPNATSIGRILSAPKNRTNGMGRKLLEATLFQMKRLFGDQTVRIGAQCYLLGFYQKFGFEKTGGLYLEDGIPHIEMILTIE
jgi:ElaA protein